MTKTIRLLQTALSNNFSVDVMLGVGSPQLILVSSRPLPY